MFGARPSLADVGASATGQGSALTLEFPQGDLVVGQSGANLRIVALGNGAEWLDGAETATVAVDPAPRTILWTDIAGPVLIGTAVTGASFAARPSAGPGTVTVAQPTNGVLAAEGNQPVLLSLAAEGNYASATQPVSVTVVLPERTLDFKLPASVVYGTTLTIADLAVTAGPGDPPRLEFPKGDLRVGQGSDNVKIGAPGTPGVCLDAERLVTIAVTPAPRTVTYTPLGKGAAVKVGTTLAAARFKTAASVGADPVIVTAPANGLVTAAGPLDIVLGFAPNANYADTPVTISVTVEKGTAVIDWANPPAIVVNAPIGAAQLNATFKFGPAAGIVYERPEGDAWVDPTASPITKEGQYFLKARFPGDADWLPAEKEVRILVSASAGAKSGADAMGSAASIATHWRHKPTDAESQAVFNNWNTDAGKMKTQGTQIMTAVQTMNEAQLRAYCNKLKGVKSKPAKPTDDDEVQWLLPNGLQLRLKPNGDRHTRSVMFAIEAVKGSTFSDDLDDVVFKLANCGEPAPKTPGQARVPTGSAVAQSDFQEGVAAATHIKCQTLQPNPVAWALATGDRIRRTHDIPVATCLDGAKVEFWVKTQKVDGWRIMSPTLGSMEVSARTTATTKYKATIVKRTITLIA